MKLGLKDIFNNYNNEAKYLKQELLYDKSNYENSKKYLISKLDEYEYYINNFTNINLKHIDKLDRLISEKSLFHIVNIQGINVMTIRRTINMIVQINKNLNKINLNLKELEANKIDESVFRDIINTFNSKISDEILKGYVFKLGGGLGVVRIKKVLCDTRVKKRINWNESNKKRKELLDNNILPFQVIERDENKKAIKDNGGEDWFVYFNGAFDYLWHWSKNYNLVPNSAYYKFRPTIYNNETSKGTVLGNVNKLAQIKSSNSELVKNYY